MAWTNLMCRAISSPHPLDPTLQSQINAYVRHQVLTSLERDFPETIQLEKTVAESLLALYPQPSSQLVNSYRGQQHSR